MSSDSDAGLGNTLQVELYPGQVSVSYLSSLLRIMQAALREVARSEERSRPQFDRRPQPMLLVSTSSADSALTLRFTFAHPLDSTPLVQLSTNAFGAFLDRFAEFVRGLPQRGLWGGAARRPMRNFDSEVERRMDQVYRELRRWPRVFLRFQQRAIEIEGDRMEVVSNE